MDIEINVWAVVVTTIVIYIIGALWYSLLFQKQWMKVTGATNRSEAEMKQMQKEAMPLYVIQLIITVVQVYVLAHFINANPDVSAYETAAWAFLGFVAPTLISAVMWTGAKRDIIKLQLMVQFGCQIVSFAVMAAILGMWN